MTKENLSQIIESSISKIELTNSERINDFRWRIVSNNVEVQIAIEEQLLSISLYFVVMQLLINSRAACIEELMKAHFHTQSKYTLFNDFILLMVNISQTNAINAEYFSELLTVYIQHVVLLRNDLYQRYYV